jgi:hypothetical protein
MKKLMSLIACVTALAFITPAFAQDDEDAPKKGKKTVKKVDKKEVKKVVKKVKKAKKDDE